MLGTHLLGPLVTRSRIARIWANFRIRPKADNCVNSLPHYTLAFLQIPAALIPICIIQLLIAHLEPMTTCRYFPLGGPARMLVMNAVETTSLIKYPG